MAGRMRPPEFAVRPVLLDQLSLAVQHQRREATLRVGIRGAHDQQRSLGIERLALRERAIRLGAVLEALLLYVQVAERVIEARFIRCRTVPLDCHLERRRPVTCEERDRERPQRISAQLLLRARQFRLRAQASVANQHAVEQHEERGRAVGVARLLEERPAPLVERLLIECRRRPARQDRCIRLPGLGVMLLAEESFAAPELGFVEVAAVGVRGDQSVEHGTRLDRLADALVRACKLVEDGVCGGRVGLLLEQTLVGRYGLAGRRDGRAAIRRHPAPARASASARRRSPRRLSAWARMAASVSGISRNAS